MMHTRRQCAVRVPARACMKASPREVSSSQISLNDVCATRDVSSPRQEWPMTVRPKNGRITKDQVARLEKRVIAHWLKKYGVKKSKARKGPGRAMEDEQAA